jgi:UDP-galactopyranose mutase
MKKKFAIVGAGFSGLILARELAEKGFEIDVFESRNHLGGNCYTERDSETGIMVHKYGPHIFHTDNLNVWNYVNRFTEFVPFVNRVKTNTLGEVYSLPINLHTINQLFKKTLNPNQAKIFIKSLSQTNIINPISFEEQALKFVGKEIYERFLKGYTLKQWGINPSELPASILKRLPVRFNYDDNYFSHQFQGIPRNGYTPIFESLIEHERINLFISTCFTAKNKDDYDHVFYSGPIDAWFDYDIGRLGYRTLDFKKEKFFGDYQGCAVMNYPDIQIKYTRITEHKYFTPWEEHAQTIIFKEFSRQCGENDIPYYPIRLVKERTLLNSYIERAKFQKNISFIGRLGTYRYLDMDVTITEALAASKQILSALNSNNNIPVFFIDSI